MRNRFLLYVAAVIFVCSYIGTSCKKIIHSNAPTPNNIRMMAYKKITTIDLTSPAAGMPATISENFRFYYDEGNRVNRILYTGNDSFEIHKDITFEYKRDENLNRDVVYKTTTNVLTKAVVERDTFILNGNEQIVTAYTPFLKTTYEYYGKLLSRVTREGTSHNKIIMTDFSTYTSDNGDFFEHQQDPKLTVTFTGLTDTFNFVWTQGIAKSELIKDYYNTTYIRNGYNYDPVYVHALDRNAIKDSLMYPGSMWVNEKYDVYGEKANRIGDYMQLESFTFFGRNIYANSHLVRDITSRRWHAAVTHDFDSQSKIKQTKVVLTDSVLNTYTSVYDIQYETY